MSNTPFLSVVMSVYNGEKYLSESIESILNQTYRNFEFIIINDGSTDNTGKIIEEYARKDNRVISVDQENMGLTRSLNRGIKIAIGDYIARQDSDDVSLPHRFESQIDFFRQNPGLVLCGTWFEEINENQGSVIRKYPLDDKILRQYVKYVNYFCHPSVMFSKKIFKAVGGYDESFSSGQDFELWIRMAKEGKISNLPMVLVKKRIGFSNTISWLNRKQKISMARKTISKHFSKWYEINPYKFIRFYLPKLIYGFIPVPILRVVRRLRYRKPVDYI